MVDVEDVAAAHILAALIPSAKGRYLCVSGTTDLHTLLKQTEPLLKPPRKVVGMKAPLALVWVLSKFGVMPWDTAASCYNKVPKVDNSKSVKELGIKYIPATQSLADMAEAIEKLRAEKKQT